VIRRVAATPLDSQCTNAITAGELLYGAAKLGSASLWNRIDEMLAGLEIVPFDAEAAAVFGRVRAELERIGRPAPVADLRIAAIALTRGMTVVTGNVRHFSNVPGLVVEDWLAEP
jgi:tRNA(fMet)-specific endonuclease VapC